MPLTIAIAGAGIAGLAIANLLIRQGHRVDLFDQSPAPAPVGSGLIIQPVGLAALDAIGCVEPIKQQGARIDRLLGRAVPSQNIVLDVGYGCRQTDRHGVAVHRATLFQALLSQLKAAGSDIRHNCEVAGSETGRNCEYLLFADGKRSGPFDVIINALGTRSVLSPKFGEDLPFGALWANVPAPSKSWYQGDKLEQRYEHASKMVGMLPIGTMPGDKHQLAAFFWSLKQTDYAAWREAPLDAWKEDVRAIWPDLEETLTHIKDHDDLVMARYRHGTLWEPVRGRIVHIGDAWHSTSPQLGQGANMALLDAVALGLAIERRSNLDQALSEFVRTRQIHIRFYQLISKIFTPFYQSDSKLLSFIRDHLMSSGALVPPMPLLLSGLVSGILTSPLQQMQTGRLS